MMRSGQIGSRSSTAWDSATVHKMKDIYIVREATLGFKIEKEGNNKVGVHIVHVD
jgi:hypothetical protein